MFVCPTVLRSSLSCWPSARSGETSMVQNQAEKSVTPNRQTIEKMPGMCVQISASCQQRLLTEASPAD